MTSIAVVVLDTLRNDFFVEHFDWLPGVRYESAWSPSHRTPPVHAALFCGKYPAELGFDGESDALGCAEPTLAERLSEEGYETVAFSANPYISTHFDFDRGFRTFEMPWTLDGLSDDVFDWRSAAGDVSTEGAEMYVELLGQLLRSDEKVLPSLRHGLRLFLNNRDLLGVNDSGVTEATEFVSTHAFDDDAFLFLNLMEAHEPYVPPQSFRTTGITDHPSTVEMTVEGFDADPDGMRRAYEDSVRYLASKYRELFADLRESFDYVITCADHGELLDRDGQWGHFYGVYPELTNVPLVVWNGEEEGRTSETVVSLLDVHRTVLDATGTAGESRGTSLLDEPAGGTYLSTCFGISADRLSNLDDGHEAGSRVERYASPVTGLASPTDYYRYETPDGTHESGTSIHDDPEAVQRELESDLTPSVGHDDRSVSESVNSRLEELGYL